MTAGDRDPMAVTKRQAKRDGVDAFGRQRPGEHGGAVVVGRVELEPDRLDPGATATAQRPVPCERRLEAVGEDDAESLHERDDDRGRRGEGRRALRLRPCAGAPSPSRSAASVARSGRSQARSETDANARPGGVISAFCEPVTTTSAPHASVSSGTAPRLDTASTTDSAPASRHAASSGSRSQTTPVDVSEWTRNTVSAPLSASARATSSGRGRSPHAYAQRHDVEPERRAPSPASARRTRPARRRGRDRRAREDSRSPTRRHRSRRR